MPVQTLSVVSQVSQYLIIPVSLLSIGFFGYTIRGCQDDAAIERKRVHTMETTVRRVDRKLGLFDALPTT